MAKLYDMAQMTVTAAPGTGTISLNAGAATDGITYQTFAAAGAQNGDLLSYRIRDGTSWEVGMGTYATGTPPTLSRGALFSNLGAGSANAIAATINALVAIAALAENFGFSESVGWLAGANPNNAIIFTNNTGRTIVVVGIVGMVSVVNSAALTVDVYKQTNGSSAALSSGTKLSTASSFTAIETVGTPKTMLSGGSGSTYQLAQGDRIGIVVSGTPDNSVATITVYMQ